MNYLDIKTGELFINKKKYELTKMECKILTSLLNNEMQTYTQIYNFIYDENEKYVDCNLTNFIRTHLSRMRNKGLTIITKYGFGARLVDKIELKNGE